MSLKIMRNEKVESSKAFDSMADEWPENLEPISNSAT